MIDSNGIFKSCNFNYKEYEELNDSQLIEKIRSHDEMAEKYLYIRYSYIVRRIVSSFFIIGGEKDDLFQEAMIGLISAVNSYDTKYNTSFRYYAELCIRRQIISAIRKTKKYEAIKNSISIYESIDSDSEEIIVDKLVNSDSLNPENVFIVKEEQNIYEEITDEFLSKFEKAVLIEYGKGKSYEEIALSLKKNVKSIDNALQRIKKKICKVKEKIINC